MLLRKNSQHTFIVYINASTHRVRYSVDVFPVMRIPGFLLMTLVKDVISSSFSHVDQIHGGNRGLTENNAVDNPKK